jgi:predicted nucleic-acid-binding protein
MKRIIARFAIPESLTKYTLESSDDNMLTEIVKAEVGKMLSQELLKHIKIDTFLDNGKNNMAQAEFIFSTVKDYGKLHSDIQDVYLNTTDSKAKEALRKILLMMYDNR